MFVPVAKLLAVMIVTAMAIVGLVFDLKLPSGELSRWGQLALALTLLSGLVAVFLEIREYLEETRNRAAEEAAERAKKETLEEIAKNIKSVDQPLMPIAFFFGLRIPVLSSDFEHYESSNLFTSEHFMALVEPLSKTQDQYRLQLPSAYVDIKDGRPIAAGFYKLNSPNLNLTQEACNRRYLRLDAKDIFEGVRDGAISQGLLHQPTSMELTVTSGKESATLTVFGKVDGFQPVGLLVMDDVMHVYFMIEAGEVRSSKDQVWGFRDLSGAEIDLELQYFLIDGLDHHSEESLRSTSLHNFQILCGDQQERNVALSDGLLSGQVWRESDRLKLAGPTKMLALSLQTKVSEGDFVSKAKFSR